jgi:hypothetical protein
MQGDGAFMIVEAVVGIGDIHETDYSTKVL